jgi:hypothetical protein
VLPACIRHRNVELAGQRPVRDDEPGEPRAVLFGARPPIERNGADRLVACADCVVCAGSECVIGAATSRFIGTAATARATAASASEARVAEGRCTAEGRRASPISRSSATVA